MLAYEAVAKIFEELSTHSEQTSNIIAVLFRYVQLHKLWKGYPNASDQSAEGLVRSLASGDVIELNIAVGASTETAKRSFVYQITELRGPAWHQTRLIE